MKQIFMHLRNIIEDFFTSIGAGDNANSIEINLRFFLGHEKQIIITTHILPHAVFTFFLKLAGKVAVLSTWSDDSSPAAAPFFSPFFTFEFFAPIFTGLLAHLLVDLSEIHKKGAVSHTLSLSPSAEVRTPPLPLKQQGRTGGADQLARQRRRAYGKLLGNASCPSRAGHTEPHGQNAAATSLFRHCRHQHQKWIYLIWKGQLW